MSESFIVRRGGSGGGGKLFAAISVTYPEGSTVTCTDGTKSLKPQGSDGKAIFLVPYAATWTVTATNGTNTSSKAVSITTEGQAESVTLAYELMLFDYGDKTAITGGWTRSAKRFLQVSGQAGGNAPTITTNTDGSIKITSGGAGVSGSYITSNKIDLSGYGAVKFIGSVGIEADFVARSGFAASNNLTEFLKPNSAANMNFPSVASKTYDGTTNFLDVSALDGEYYLLFGVYNNTSITLKKLWLE